MTHRGRGDPRGANGVKMDTDPWARRTVRFGSLTEAREAVNDPRFLDSFFRVARCSMPRSCSRCWPAPCVHHSRSRALGAGVDDDAGRGRRSSADPVLHQVCKTACTCRERRECPAGR